MDTYFNSSEERPSIDELCDQKLILRNGDGTYRNNEEYEVGKEDGNVINSDLSQELYEMSKDILNVL